MNREIEKLLPFYLNGTLSADENNKVAEALAQDEALQAELSLLKNIQHQIKTQEFQQSPGELGLKRLQRDITKSVQAQQQNNTTTSRFWPLTAAAACLIVILQTGYMISNSTSNSTLSPAGGTSLLNAVPTHSVTFIPSAQEQDIRTLLLSLNATIVAGPSALGVYKLHIRNDADQALSRLQAQSSLIESAQLERQAP